MHPNVLGIYGAMQTSAAVIVWWTALCVVAVVNMAVWTWLVFSRFGDAQNTLWRRAQFALSAVFVFGCAFRSFLPRAEGQRFCLYDSWISAAPIARIVATLAELSFVAQVSLVLYALAGKSGSRTVAILSLLPVPLIAMAEVFSWYTALTTNFIGSVFEESTWALTFSIAILGFAILCARSDGTARAVMAVAMGIAAGYVLFMCTVDVPMYWHRWLRDEAANVRYLSVGEGWSDSWVRRVVTRRWEDWREEMPWMTLYFSGAVWISIAMTLTPRRLFQDQRPVNCEATESA
jgi:hypothetical protein